MNILSLFDGISCGRVALERTGIPINKYYACEIDKFAIQTALKNYQDTIELGNVFDLSFNDLKDIDIVIGGSPCQKFSIAKNGRETSLNGEGGKLFYKFKEAVDTLKPKYFLLENVASMHKDVRDAISKELGVEPILINSALVSAQQRKRFYWTNIPVCGLPEDKEICLKDILESGFAYSDKSTCITARYSVDYLRRQRQMVGEPIRIGNVNGSNGQGNRVYSVRGKSICLSANGGGMGSKTGLYKIDLPDGDYIIRKLTPIECERLQTLPDNYTAGVSNTQRYKQCGNGWTVDVIAWIFKHI